VKLLNEVIGIGAVNIRFVGRLGTATGQEIAGSQLILCQISPDSGCSARHCQSIFRIIRSTH
jgi:hypothetical protein